MNRLEVIGFLESFFAKLGNAAAAPRGSSRQSPSGTELKPFLDLVLSLRRDLPLAIPLLRDLAGMAAPGTNRDTGLIKRRIDRRFRRLCRIQEELSRLDLKKAAPAISQGTALEDFVFSRIDFARYRKMDEKEFDMLFPEGLTDFDETFFKKIYGIGREEIQSLVAGSYKKADGVYSIQRENPLILSVMRTLETSLETSPLFTARETEEELKNLLGFVGAGKGRSKGELLPGMELLYPLLVSSLDNVSILHEDGMTTKLFISPKGDLSGTFRPGNKPWTLILIPANSNLPLSLSHN